MAKRFTETGKWSDPWFRNLSMAHKLAWNYLCDNCDTAGIIALDMELANFQIGGQIEWSKFIAENKKRIHSLGEGKFWIIGLVVFQNPNGISRDCRAHKPIFASLEKHGLLQRVLKQYSDGINTVHEKEKEEDKDKEQTGKGDARGKTKRDPIEAAAVPVPDGFEIPSVRQAIGDWLAYKAKRGEAYRDPGYLGRKVAEFARAGPGAFVAAVNSSMGNNYQGIYPAKDANGKQQKSAIGPGQLYDGS